ncbi:hypothetical protein C8T65DRAFT_736345 [Cerioporus squamosus]|nr:hypothetical protein C8T65DRAFT_736345 [Cerioporus squamosus]
MATATTTTQILFNSPALHSLKRDQLVKLCKIHSIKANGKNTELIERLKQRALELPPEAALADEEEDPDVNMDMDTDTDGLPGGMPGNLDFAGDGAGNDAGMQASDATTNAESEDLDSEMQDVVLTSRFSIPRPSEQWEVVMEDIAELDETMGTASSKDSLRTAMGGEFGTHSSKASVTSSIRALATSLGIKRVTSKSSHHPHDIDIDAEGSKMPSFSPGKLFGSSRARDSLAEHATPYADLPPADSLPETDYFKFATPDASILEDLNGDEDGNGPDAPRSPKPAPRTAMLFGSAVKSTVRLVSHPAAPKTSGNDAYMSPPRLPVVQTDFDITVGTPARHGRSQCGPLLRALLEGRQEPGSSNDADDEDEQMSGGMGAPATTPARASMKGKGIATSEAKPTTTPGPVDEPDMFSPAKPRAAPTSTGVAATPAARATLPRSTPFLFGSPLPRRETPAGAEKHKDDHKDDATAGVSNAAFDGAAKSVLEEMHRRLAEANAHKSDGGAPKAASSSQAQSQSIFGGFTFGATASAQAQAQTQDRFAKVHDAEFSKMDSIANHYAARRPNKRKSDALGPGGASRPVAGQKRRSSAQGARVISAGARKRMAVPGGFGGDEEEGEGDDDEAADEGAKTQEDEEEDAGARRSSKRIRITEGWDVHRGQRVSIAPPLPPADEEKKQKEHDAAKRELNAVKARRRSSRGRPSMGAPPAKGKASRFGFLGAAKSLVRNVWNMGGGSKTKPATANAPPSSIPVPKTSTQPPASGSSGSVDKKGEKAKTDAVAAAATNTRKASGPTNKLLKPPPKASDAKSTGTGTVTSTKSTASRARSPIPPFTAPSAASGTVRSTASAASRPSNATGTVRSRVSSISTTTGTAASRQSGRTSTVSSMGTRSSTVGTSTAASSIGTRRSIASTNTLASTSSSKGEAKSTEGTQPSLRKRTSSLLAPTASSLAKTSTAMRPSASGRTSGLPAVAEAQKPKRASVTQAVSSSKATIAAATSPLSASSSSGATPVHHPSLTAAATSIMDTGATTTDAASSPSKIPRPAVIPPKPKQLVARKPRLSRSRVIAKLGAQRAAAAQGSALLLASPSGGRTRSSVGARRSFGGVKSGRASGGSEVMRSAMIKKRARQSEYMRRKSRPASENVPLATDD